MLFQHSAQKSCTWLTITPHPAQRGGQGEIHHLANKLASKPRDHLRLVAEPGRPHKHPS